MDRSLSLAHSLSLTLCVCYCVCVCGVGEFLVTMTFTLCYSITADAYPTAFRASGVGFGVTMGRLGAMSAPMVGALGRHYGQLWMYVIFAGTSLVAAMVGFLLPIRQKATGRRRQQQHQQQHQQ